MDRDTIAAFYDLSRDMAAMERERFEQAEGKAWRHLYVLVVLLGFALVSSGRTALRLIKESPTALEATFMLAFGFFLVSSFAAGLVSVWNFRVALTLEPPADRSIEVFAIGSSATRFHLELGREFMRAAAENRQVADTKYRLLKWNFRLLILALILGIVLGALFPLLLRGS
jgi:hypothetical protein